MDLTKLYDFIQVLIIKGRHPTKVIIFLSLNFFLRFIYYQSKD
jgi:hypothetical protein